MIQFFKASFRELKHVVWPTKEETKSFFMIVLAVLILFWVYLFLVNFVFSEAMFSLRKLVSWM